MGISGLDKSCGRPHAVVGLQMYRIIKSVLGSFSRDCLLLKQGSIVMEAGYKFTSRPAPLLIPYRASLFVMMVFTA
jgi:hypothetical protein